MKPLKIKFKKRKIIDEQAILGRSMAELPPMDELEWNYKHLIPRFNKILKLIRVDEVSYSSKISKRDNVTDSIPVHWCTILLYSKLGCNVAFDAPSKIIEICDNTMKITVYPDENSELLKISLEISLSQNKKMPNKLSWHIFTLDDGFSKEMVSIDGSIVFNDKLRVIDNASYKNECIPFAKISDKGQIVGLDFTEGFSVGKHPNRLEHMLFRICDWEDVKLFKKDEEIYAEYSDFIFSVNIDGNAGLIELSKHVNFDNGFSSEIFEEAFDVMTNSYYGVEVVKSGCSVNISVELIIKGNADIKVNDFIQKLWTLRVASSYFVANAKILMDYTEVPELRVGLPDCVYPSSDSRDIYYLLRALLPNSLFIYK